jgi:ABC-type branched-subunit amino acid transport system permease subunit
MVLIGGAGSIYGAVLGTLFIVLMENLLFLYLKMDWQNISIWKLGDFKHSFSVL